MDNKNDNLANSTADNATDNAKTPALKLENFSFSWGVPASTPINAPADAAANTSTDISKSTPAPTYLLENINLTLEKGEFALLTGKTGCGKTTFLRALKPELNLTGNAQGVRQIFGKDLNSYTQKESASTIGYVQQDPAAQITCDSVWHELVFGLENIGEHQDVMQLRVAEIANYFGIEKWFHKRCAELSDGQKQLLNLASALTFRPQLLLLDEPTSMLDKIAEKNFLHMLFRLNKELGITIIVATHDVCAMQNYATCELALNNAHIEKRVISKKAPSQKLPVQKAPAQGVFAKEILPQEILPPKMPNFMPSQSKEQTKAQTYQNHPSPALCAKNIYYSYAKDAMPVLRECSLKIEAGQIHAIIGGNGSGKTTLLKLFAGILKPQLGKISSPFKGRQRYFKGKQGYLPQSPKELFVNDTVEEELNEWQHLAGYSQEDITNIASKFNIGHLLQQHPLDTSIGQQQLIALAKILLCKPHLLLLDEPSKGLDAQAKLQLTQILCSLVPQTTIVFATHDLNFAACIAQNISFLFDGRIINTAAPDTFFIDNMFYRPMPDEFSELLHNKKWDAGTKTTDQGVINSTQ